MVFFFNKTNNFIDTFKTYKGISIMTFSLRFHRSRSCVRGPRAFWDLTPCRFSRDIVEIISRNTNSAGRSLFRAFIAKCFDKSHAFSILPPAVTWAISLRSRNSDFTWFIYYRCMWNILFYVLEMTERAAIRLCFFVVFVSKRLIVYCSRRNNIFCGITIIAGVRICV